MAEIDPEDAIVTVRVLRALRGWSQAELAERAGLEVSSIQRYESGRPIPPITLAQLAKAAGLSERLLYTQLLPAVHFWCDGIRPTAARSGEAMEREIAEREATRAAEASAAATRGAFLRAWGDHVRQALEQEAGAWRPRPEDREEALDLWQHLKMLAPEEREILLRHGTHFHSWALAERVADLAAGKGSGAPGLELAQLAVRIANQVPGSEPWKARVRAYALAALAHTLQGTGDPEAEHEVRCEAERLWTAGAEEAGPLSTERFQAALGGLWRDSL